MVTTSRLIVILRSELGNQLKIACSEYKNIQDNLNLASQKDRQKKLLVDNRNRQRRIRIAAEAIGSLTLGDIEDNEHSF